MNREIIYRGKRCSDGEWVYGFYVESKYSWQGHKPHKSWIVPNAISNGGFFNVLGRYAVKDDTVGQFTGLVDKNGVKIFEGDIVRVCDEDGIDIGVVKYNEDFGKYVVVYSQVSGNWFDFEGTDGDFLAAFCSEVIGNRYDNPDLLLSK